MRPSVVSENLILRLCVTEKCQLHIFTLPLRPPKERDKEGESEREREGVGVVASDETNEEN